MDFHLSIKLFPNRKFTNGNITLIGRGKKIKMKEQCDEILKQFGFRGVPSVPQCTQCKLSECCFDLYIRTEYWTIP